MDLGPCHRPGWWVDGPKRPATGHPTQCKAAGGDLSQTHTRHLLEQQFPNLLSDRFARMSQLIPSQKGNPQAGQSPGRQELANPPEEVCPPARGDGEADSSSGFPQPITKPPPPNAHHLQCQHRFIII